MPTLMQIASFNAEHSEPLINIPPEHAHEYHAGKLAVLVPLPGEGDELVLDAIGFAEADNEALGLIRQRIIDLPAVHQRSVYYYSDSLWPPAVGMAFEPLIGPSPQLAR